MSPLTVVVTGVAEEPPPGIDALSGRVDLRYAMEPEELAAVLPGVEVVFVWEHAREALEEAWPSAGSLRWIQASSAGVDGVLFPALVESSVVLTSAGGVFDEPMAEYVLLLMLTFAKDLHGTLRRQRERRWEHRETERLGGARVVVVGTGPIGRAIGRAARSLGMQVTGVARSARPADDVYAEIAPVDRLREMLEGADFVVNALPLTAETRRLFDEAAFAAMRPSARFLNVGRGKTVDEAALVEALRDGRIAGAALDVFEREPLPGDSPLWDMDDVIVSPHMSGDFAGYERVLVDLFVDNVERFLRGAPLQNVVDKRLGYPPSA